MVVDILTYIVILILFVLIMLLFGLSIATVIVTKPITLSKIGHMYSKKTFSYIVLLSLVVSSFVLISKGSSGFVMAMLNIVMLIINLITDWIVEDKCSSRLIN